METKNGNPNLLVLEARTDISELLIDAEALLLFVLAIAYVADEHREASHPWQRHRRSDPHSHTRTRTHKESVTEMVSLWAREFQIVSAFWI